MDEENDRFPLHTAARLGNVTKAEGLLKTDPKLAAKQDEDGRYPIHWAASSNNLEIVRLLVNQEGFDPDVQPVEDGSGWTPLMISASVPDGEPVLRVLIQRGADINEKSSSGQTALHFVASKKNLDIARLLIETKPPASTRVRDRRGQYPIHRAAAVGSVPMVVLLLQNRSPLNATDNEGYTPLHHAVAEGDAAIALLKEGADFTLKNAEDVLAMDLAPDKEVHLYIRRGAEREGIDLSP
ncbi:putative ankyrin-repeat protein [Conoideocrella luteorostrata]|uniref:Ankyrin-repeat protein n=1 Tax=Conoideocrella luteorostrata TaxID=1105319 RepID=A0AAJ0CV79_9HYPO|nr:putative ankyrin-repeat protein [Conoideocrella luteorostrata]